MVSLKGTSVTGATKKQLEAARQQALSIAKLAQSSGSATSLKRKDVHTFGVNPNTKIVVQHREIWQGADAAQRYIDSGAMSGVSDPRIISGMNKLASGNGALTKEEVASMTEYAKARPSVQKMLEMRGNNVSISKTVDNDVSACVTKWSVSRALTSGGTGRVSMQVDDENVLRTQLTVGDKFYIYIEDELIFWGICTQLECPNEWEIDCVVNDSMWYLRNNLVWVQNTPVTLSDAFVNICEQLGLPYEKPNIPPTTPIKPRVETSATAMTILQTFLQETMIAMNKQFFIRMSPDKIELVDAEGRWEGNKLIQDGTKFDVVEAMTSFKSSVSIQDETYNDVRIFSNIKKTLHGYNVQDLPSIERYGILRYQQVLSNAIIKEQSLDNILRITKYPTNDLSFDIVGLINLLPGDTIRLMQSIYLCASVECTYDGSGYGMSIGCARWQKPMNQDGDKVGEDWDFVHELNEVRKAWEDTMTAIKNGEK